MTLSVVDVLLLGAVLVLLQLTQHSTTQDLAGNGTADTNATDDAKPGKIPAPSVAPDDCQNKFINISDDLIYSISSPGHPQPYQTGVSCSWFLHTANKKYAITFQLWVTDLPFDSFCDLGSIFIYNGPTINDSTLQERVCGTALAEVKSTAQDLVIVFNTSDTYPNTNLVGFKANFYATDTTKKSMRDTVAWSLIGLVNFILTLVIVRSVIPSQSS